jgi:hypothetical protein
MKDDDVEMSYKQSITSSEKSTDSEAEGPASPGTPDGTTTLGDLHYASEHDDEYFRTREENDLLKKVEVVKFGSLLAADVSAEVAFLAGEQRKDSRRDDVIRQEVDHVQRQYDAEVATDHKPLFCPQDKPVPADVIARIKNAMYDEERCNLDEKK